MNKNYYAILMAGGVGSRFWPVSTTEFPKQFHDMLGSGQTLLQKTFARLEGLIPTNNINILTNDRYIDIVLEQLPTVQKSQVVLEPAMRNTAPCILYASLKIKKQNPNAVVVVAPSDHWIEDEMQFVANIQRSFDFCEIHIYENYMVVTVNAGINISTHHNETLLNIVDTYFKNKQFKILPIKVPNARTIVPNSSLKKRIHIIIEIGVKIILMDENLNSSSMVNNPLKIDENPQNSIQGATK